jgi:peptidoglycan/xylan/chitin deacetylase (PgdA/CDA1 family)
MPRPLLAVVVAALALAGCGKEQSKPSAGAAPARTPAPRTDPAAMAARADVPVLCYHQIRRPTSADGPRERAYIVSPKALAAQLAALDRAGYNPITGEALVGHVARGTPLPRKPILLTFDDASAGQFTHALPLLRRHDFVATFFVMTVVLDKPGWLTSEQVRRLDRAGMTIGAHSYDHESVPGYAGEDWRAQIVRPAARLAKVVGHPVWLFAYPNGLWSRAAFPRLSAAGYVAAFQLADKLDRRDPLWTLRRIIVPELSGPELLRQIRRDF